MFLGDFSLFEQGRGRKLTNLIRGRSQSVEVAIFDYRYTTGGGESSTTYKQTVVRFKSDSLGLPKFELRPEHLGHRLAKLFGYQDIDFPGHPKFSKKYLLRGKTDRPSACLFTPDVIEHLESLDGLHVVGHGSKLIVYRHNKRVRPAELGGFPQRSLRYLHPIENRPRRVSCAECVATLVFGEPWGVSLGC